MFTGPAKVSLNGRKLLYAKCTAPNFGLTAGANYPLWDTWVIRSVGFEFDYDSAGQVGIRVPTEGVYAVTWTYKLTGNNSSTQDIYHYLDGYDRDSYELLTRSACSTFNLGASATTNAYSCAPAHFISYLPSPSVIYATITCRVNGSAISASGNLGLKITRLGSL